MENLFKVGTYIRFKRIKVKGRLVKREMEGDAFVKENVDEYISPEDFGHFFLTGNPETLYKQCIKDFK